VKSSAGDDHCNLILISVKRVLSNLHGSELGSNTEQQNYLRICSSNVPDLTLIYIPESRPPTSPKHRKKLCAKYIHEPDTVITSRLTRKQDGRLWTIGIITTMDLVPAEQSASILVGSRYPRGLCQRREMEEGC